MALFEKDKIGSRIKEAQTHLGVNSSQMADKIKADPAYLNKVEKGIKPLSEKYLEALHIKYNVNPVWVLFGVGEMIGPIGQEKTGKLPEEFEGVVREEIETIQASLLRLSKNLTATFYPGRRTVGEGFSQPSSDILETSGK